MTLWILLAVITAGVSAVLIWPLMTSARPVEELREDEAAVYRDQLREVDRDRAQGLIGVEEAGYAKAEIGRRLLALADKRADDKGTGGGAASRARHRLAPLSVILSVPLIGLCLYLFLGNPDLPAQPLEARLANPGNNMALLVAKAERHLAEKPDDGAGWDLLAPIYFRAMRLGDAEMAYRNAIRLNGESSERLAGLGETLVASNEGVVTEDARHAFDRAVALDGRNMRARFYAALALEQAGRTDDARRAFEAILKDSPPGAAWIALVSEHIGKNGGAPLAAAPTAPAAAQKAPGNPNAAQVEAMQQLSPQERQQMIAGMVDTLAARLRDDPDNIEGWLRLVRSYMVLGDKAKASDALKAGLKTFPTDQEAGRRLLALAKETGLSAEGVTP
ncbi:c-type cytochrome biogenesis protein CcmI [Rhizobium sp. SGZ-381]|uniref:c-type cytochrome biogenesis protein CcmI n=1 Tax=Rhizobium sp. SGZ-381 TaxID=3342800 RepID=UPI00366FD50B